MSVSARRKGNAAEVEVCHAIERAGYHAVTSRAARGGMQAGSDIVTNLPVSIEVKNQAKMELSAWLNQAQDQAEDKPAVVVHKRRGKSQAEDWYVTTDLKTLIRIIELCQ